MDAQSRVMLCGCRIMAALDIRMGAASRENEATCCKSSSDIDKKKIDVNIYIAGKRDLLHLVCCVVGIDSK